MYKLLALWIVGVAAAPAAIAEEEEATESEERAMSGMSVVGNQEAPKALVIVPWKSSEMSAGIGLSDELEDIAAPVDKEVFGRELSYYAIRSGSEVRSGSEN